jgi:hypothetical protein
MNVYEAFFDLKPGVRDLEFVGHLDRYLGHLQAQGLIESWRLLRAKLGLGLSGHGDWHLLIETRDLAQLDAAFFRVAARDEPEEAFHHCVNASVTSVRFALYRDFPDPVRKTGAERF